MAKKIIPKAKDAPPTSPHTPLLPKIIKLLKDERVHYLLGGIFILTAAYLFISFTTFLFSDGFVDGVDQMGDINNDVINITGPLGDTISQYCINGWVGLGAYALVFMLIIIAWRILKGSSYRYAKKLFWCVLGMFWISLFFGYFFIKSYQDSFLFLGGRHGYYMSTWLQSIFGSLGTLFIVIFVLLGSLLMASSKSVEWINKLFNYFKNKFKSKQVPAEEIPDTNNNHEVHTTDPRFEPLTTEEDFPPASNDSVLEKAPSPSPSSGSPMTVNALHEEEYEIEDDVEQDADLTMNINHHIDELSDEDATNIDELEDYDPTLDLASYQFPSLKLLKEYPVDKNAVSEDELLSNKNRIEDTLGQYGIKITSITATIGPTITLYEIIPAPGVKISKIKNLEDDIALSLAALGIRIIAPMPGKGTVGIEVPNRTMEIVSMHSILRTKKFQESTFDLPVALGRTITNETYMVDLCKMPHMLMAGATGQGKSVGLNAIVTSLLYKKHPSQLKFVFIDPKKVEFSIYSKIEKHFLAKLPDTEDPIITDVHKSVQTLNSITAEMDQRYDLLKKAHVRNIKEYNAKFISRKLNPNNGHKFLPYIVVIVDEYGDLIMTAGKEVELPIARIAQLARAVGIHMIIATQRPSANIITGIIKANFPARVSFRVSSMVDSRTILDASGANQLIGRGDMLISTGNEMIRVQCAFVDTPEVEDIVKFIGDQRGYPTAFLLPEPASADDDMMGGSAKDVGVRDDMFEEAARLVVAHQQGSTSLIQRRFSIGYNRAGRIVDQLEAAGIIGPFEGSKARQVLVQDENTLERLLNSSNQQD